MRAVVLVLLCSCRSLVYVSEATVPLETDVVEGQTHYAEILEEFGAPVFMAEIPQGFAMLYEHIVISETSVGMKLADAGYFGTSGGDRQYRSAILLFGEDGVLFDSLMSGQDLETGSGLQVATSGKKGFVGARDYGAGPSQFNWGMRDLNALPLALNERWGRIEIGEGGLELIDTPRDVGQHTLGRPRPLIVKPTVVQ